MGIVASEVVREMDYHVAKAIAGVQREPVVAGTRRCCCCCCASAAVFKRVVARIVASVKGDHRQHIGVRIRRGHQFQ